MSTSRVVQGSRNRYRHRGGPFVATKKSDAFARLVLRTRRRTERNECIDRFFSRPSSHQRGLVEVRVRHSSRWKTPPRTRSNASLSSTSSFVEDSEHSAIAKSISADIVAFKNEEVEENEVAKYRSCDKGKVKEAVRKKRVDIFVSADKIITDATNLKKVR